MALPRLNYYKFRPTDSEPGLDVYSKVIDGTAKQYDEALDKRDKLTRAIGSIQTNANGQVYMDKVSNNANTSLAMAVDAIQRTGDFGMAENTIRELTNKFASDKVVAAIKMSHDNEVKGLDEKQKLAEKGEVINLNDDYEDWKPVNEDGTVNVYKPLYQNVADYHGSAKSFMKDMPTELQMAVDANQNIPGFMSLKQTQRLAAGKKEELMPQYLTSYAGSEAGRQQAIRVKKQLKNSGLSEEQIAKRIQDEQYNTVRNAIDSREDEVYQEKLQLVADPIYTETVRQRQRDEVREDKREDQAALIKLREESAIRVAQAKADMKKKALSGSSDNSRVLGTMTTVNSDNANTTRDNVSTFKNEAFVEGFKAIVNKPVGNNWEGIKVDKSIDKIPEGAIIKDFTPLGIAAFNNFEPEYDGAWYGRIKYTDKDGKNEREANAHMINKDTTIVNNYKGINELKRWETKLRQGKEVGVARVLDNRELFKDSKYPVTMEMIRNDKGISVVPTIDILDDKGRPTHKRVADIPNDVKKAIGLDGVQSRYTVEQLRNLADYHFSQQMQVSAATRKDVSGMTQPIEE